MENAMGRAYQDIFVNCKVCGKSFKSIESKLKNGRGVYCSTECANKGFFLNYVEKFEKIIGENLEQWLRKKYIDELWSYRKIHSIIGANARIVKKMLTMYNIPIRHGSEAVATQWVNNPERRKQRFPAKSSPVPGFGKNGVIPRAEIYCATWLDVLCVDYIPQWEFKKPDKKDGVDYEADFFLEKLNAIIEVQSSMSNINPIRHKLITDQMGMRVFYIPSRFFIEKVTREKFLKFYRLITYLERLSSDPTTPLDKEFVVWRNPYCLMQKLNSD
jgi:hypothetical protein